MTSYRRRIASISMVVLASLAQVNIAAAEPGPSSNPVANPSSNGIIEGPTPTQAQIDEIHDYLGPEAVAEIQRAQIQASNGERVVPVIAGVAIAAVAWCASGALSSIPTSVLADIVNRGEDGGDYVRNAIYGCAVGNVGGLAWKLIPTSVKQKVLNAVVRFYLEHIRK